jgi:Glucodextranase, domain N
VAEDPDMYAPGWPGIPARWTSSAKSGLGTAVSRDSRVWFTLGHGILNEVYYPRIEVGRAAAFVTRNAPMSPEGSLGGRTRLCALYHRDRDRGVPDRRRNGRRGVGRHGRRVSTRDSGCVERPHRTMAARVGRRSWRNCTPSTATMCAWQSTIGLRIRPSGPTALRVSLDALAFVPYRVTRAR